MKTRTATEAGGTRSLVFWCPGCDQAHVIPVSGERKKWEWNGDREKPTTHPSVRVMYGEGRDCHFFLKDGRFEFCADSFHELRGQTVDIPDWPKPNFGGIDEE